MKKDLLMLIGGFPPITGDQEASGYHIYELLRALTELTGIHVHILAFRKHSDKRYEEKGNISITRIDLPKGEFQLEYRTLKLAMPVLAKHASRAAESMGKGVPVLCHGYESATAAMTLRNQGHPVIGVLHYLFAQELMNRLEACEDPLRKGIFPPTMSYLAGAVLTKSLRPSFVRLLTRNASIISKLPLPSSLELLFNLEQEALYLEASHVVVAVSPGFADSIARYHPSVKNKLRYCTVGAPAPSSKSYWPFPRSDDRLRLVMVGRLEQQKGWDYAAEALRNIELKYPNEASKLEFVAIGGLEEGGDSYSNKVYRSLAGLKKISCRGLGHLPHDRVMEVMSGADALLIPSVYESFGLVMIEAMANGCMVVASDADGPRDVVKEPWGMLMNFREPKMRVSEIERGLLKLLSLPREEMQKLGEQARSAARAYSWKECAKVHAAVIEEAQKLCMSALKP